MTTPVDTANSASASNTNESGHVKVRRGTEIAEEVSAHGVFSKDTVTALEDQPEVLVEVGDFRKDLNNFAARFLALTVLFYFLMALYYRWQLDWTWINAIYVWAITISNQFTHYVSTPNILFLHCYCYSFRSSHFQPVVMATSFHTQTRSACLQPCGLLLA